MRVLYHWPLDPQSRQARIALAEKKTKFKLSAVSPWEPDPEFVRVCAEGIPPCLTDVVEGGKIVISGARAICEYASESTARHPIMSDDPVERAESRRLCSWFDTRFTDQVHAFIMHERVEKSLTGGGAPHPPTLREGREQLAFHLDYLEWLLGGREWLAGKHYSLADISAAASLSCLDFLNEVPWKKRKTLKDWYQKIKSRPSFRPLLSDRVAGLAPPSHYADLDF